MAYPILGTPVPQFFDSSGAPLANGTVTIVEPSTDVNKATYPTYDDAEALTDPNDNPITLNARGECDLWGIDGEDYKITVKDANGATVQGPPAMDDIFLPQDAFPISSSESDASITLSDKTYPPGYIERYGGLADGTTDSTTPMETANSIGRQDIKFWNTGRTDQLSTYTGRARFYIVRDAYLDRSSLIGPANLTSDGTQTESVLRLNRDIDQPNGAQWRYKKIQDITFSGKVRADNAISFGADNNYPETMALGWEINRCHFERCNIGIKKPYGNFGNHISYCSSTSGNYGYWARGYPIRSTLSGAEATGQTVLSVTDTNFVSVNDVVRVEMDDGTIHQSTVSAVTSTTVTIADATDDDAASGNYIKFYHPDDAVSTTLSQVGSDYIEGGEYSGHRKAAFYIDGQNAQGTGQTVLQNVVIESNGGFGIFVKDYNNAFSPLHLKNVWFESNGADAAGYTGTVDLGDGAGAREPQDIYMENVDGAIIEGSQIRICTFIDSQVTLDNCSFNGTQVDLTVTNTNNENHLRITNAHINGFGEAITGADSVVIESLRRAGVPGGESNARCWRAPQLTPVSGFEVKGATTIRETDRGDSGIKWQGVAPAADVERDGFVSGLSYETASQYTFLDGADYIAPTEMAIPSVNSGKWYVMTMEIKADSGLANIGAIRWGSGFNMTRGDAESLLTQGEWSTIAFVGELKDGVSGTIRPQITISTGGGSDNATVTIGASQILEFDDAQDAYNFYNKNIHLDEKRSSIRVKRGDTPTRATTTTLADDTELTGWNLNADTTYTVEGFLILDTNATADFKAAFDFSNAEQSLNVVFRTTNAIVALTDNTGGTANDTLENLADGSTYATDHASIENNFADLAAKLNELIISTKSETVTIDTGSGTGLIAGSAGDQYIDIKGTFKTNATTGGDVAFQWAQNTSNAYATALNEGSWIRISESFDPT